ncbi:MAG: helix-turn-helix domain-containing protein [Candidatus Marinimicrobia bacterium]|nr:helix-turn-helix domain-containing protein [Candidatus Neomarinimicrobiota bacterium]
MSRNNLQFVNTILDRIKEYYTLKTDFDLANFLEVHRSTVSAWRRRGAMDYGLVLQKCTDPDLNWLIYGKKPREDAYPLAYGRDQFREKTESDNDPEKMKNLLDTYREVTKAMRELLSRLPE